VTRKTQKKTAQQRWVTLSDLIHEQVPHLFSVLDNEEDFVELRIKSRPDGTTLAILKKYDMDGGPVVCFGSGYGVVGSLVAVDATVQAGNWKVDKPWQPNKG